jgi:hypothetical protein
MRRWIFTLLLLAPFAAGAQESGSNSSSGPLFMKDLVGDREFFEPWGIGVDFFTMEQDYDIQSLSFQLPGVPSVDPAEIGVTNELQHYDLKLDVWLTPFLNVFALVGRMDADTLVDLSRVSVPGLPFPLGVLPVSYDGTVYGAGVNLAYGGERWFVALNNTWTDTSLNGDFDSSVKSFTAQPRVGLIFDKWTVWAGGMYLDTEEEHSGTIELVPGLPPIPFDITLETAEKWNTAVGVGYVFGPKAHVSLEVGFGDRDHTLFNFTYRF